MEIKKKEILEDGGVQVEKPGGTFLPNFAIRVKGVTNDVEEEVKEAIGNVFQDKEVKNIYDVSLWQDNTQVQPDGTVRVKVPYDNTLKNPKVIIELEDGTFKEVEARIENGYLVYDSNYLGKIGIVDDKEVVDPAPDPKPDPTPTPNPPVENTTPSIDTKNPDTSVKGTYINGMGGAMTGDTATTFLYICILLLSGGYLSYLVKRKRN